MENAIDKYFENPIYVTRPMTPDLGDYIQRLSGVWQRGIFSNYGPEHKELEHSLCEYLSNDNVSLFNNGMSALVATLQAMKISGEVIVTPFTFSGTVHAIKICGAIPVFVDIDPITMTIDPKAVINAITKETTAILGVHVYGNACDVEGLSVIAETYNLKLIYDGAHSFGTRVNGSCISSFGDATMFSFHATKLFHTGEGGAVVVKDPALKQKIDLIRNFGILNEEEIVETGSNGKMSELQAALGNCNFQNLLNEKRSRLKISNVYKDFLGQINGITTPSEMSVVNDSLQYYAIRVEKRSETFSRDYLHIELKKHNIFARKYFYPLCSEYKCYKNLTSSNNSNLPVAHNVASEVLCLPFYGALSTEDAIQICVAIKKIIAT